MCCCSKREKWNTSHHFSVVICIARTWFENIVWVCVMKGPDHTWISDILSVVINYLAPAILLIVTHIRRPLATPKKKQWWSNPRSRVSLWLFTISLNILKWFIANIPFSQILFPSLSHLAAVTPIGHFQLEPENRAPAAWSLRSHGFFAAEQQRAPLPPLPASAEALAPVAPGSEVTSDGSTNSGSSRSDTDLNDWDGIKRDAANGKRGIEDDMWEGFHMVFYLHNFQKLELCEFLTNWRWEIWDWDVIKRMQHSLTCHCWTMLNMLKRQNAPVCLIWVLFFTFCAQS